MTTLTHERTGSGEPVPETERPASAGEKTFLGVTHGVLILWSIIVIGPMLWTLMTSFKTTREIFASPFSPPSGLNFQNYVNAWTTAGIGNYFVNTVLVVGSALIIVMILGSMCAYVLARFQFPGSRIIYYLMLAGLTFPIFLAIVPLFFTLKNLGLLNTLPGMVLPAFLMTPFAIFFLRQFFLGINREIEEAAMIDGAGPWRIFFRIILPISTAPITTLAILTFIATWNDYFWPLLVGNTDQTKVLTVALGVFRSQTPAGSPDWAGLMAATLLTALPVLILFFAFARKIIDSIGYSGSK